MRLHAYSHELFRVVEMSVVNEKAILKIKKGIHSPRESKSFKENKKSLLSIIYLANIRIFIIVLTYFYTYSPSASMDCFGIRHT